MNKSDDSACGSAADTPPDDGTTNGTGVRERDGDSKSLALGIDPRFDVPLTLIALVLGDDDTRTRWAMWRESIGECECGNRADVLALESRRRPTFAPPTIAGELRPLREILSFLSASYDVGGA